VAEQKELTRHSLFNGQLRRVLFDARANLTEPEFTAIISKRQGAVARVWFGG
jgi:hypothetical protein